MLAPTMARVTNGYMIFFPERLEKGNSHHKFSKTVSVDATQRHVGREKYTEQKGWEGNHDGGLARPKHHHTDSWASYRRDNQHSLFFWFSTT